MQAATTRPGRVNIYVDGFNLYYGSLKGTPYKWLDLAKLCATLFPGEHIGLIRYFTAVVDPYPDPGPQARQAAYLRALGTIPNLSILKGHFLTSRRDKLQVYPLNPADPSVPNPANKTRAVWVTEEKGSDVNLATMLLLDAVAVDFDRAWVFTNDSDLALPIQMVRQKFHRQVGVMMPARPASYPNPPRPESFQLKKAARWFRKIEEPHLAASQLPTSLTDASGTITKPPNW